jgi:hypothetical protein
MWYVGENSVTVIYIYEPFGQVSEGAVTETRVNINVLAVFKPIYSYQFAPVNNGGPKAEDVEVSGNISRSRYKRT